MKKIAHSRYLLPMEIFLGTLSVLIGTFGFFGAGLLPNALRVMGADITWFVLFCGVGGTRLMVTVYEWWYLRGAPERVVFQFTSARAILAFGCICVWGGALGMILKNGLLHQMQFISALALATMGFNAWSYWENLKVRYALNPKVETPNLEYHSHRRV